MDLSRIPIGDNPPHEVNVVIEIPQGGSPVKYEATDLIRAAIERARAADAP